MEQNVDIPVPGRGGRASGLQGFLPRQSSTALLSSQKRISEQIVEQIVDIRGGGLQDVRPGQSSSSSSHVPARAYDALDAPGDFFFFALFSKIKECEVGSHSGSELLPESSPSNGRAFAVPMVPEVAAPVLEVDSEDEDPDRWRDELGRLWMRSALNPQKWYLLGTGLDVNIIWEEPA